MKTSEFIKKVKHLGLEMGVNSQNILINDKEGRSVCTINRSQRFQLDMERYATEIIGDVIKEELFRIVCQYSSTPVDERGNDDGY